MPNSHQFFLVQALFFVVASCATTKESTIFVTDNIQGGTFTSDQNSKIVSEIANWTITKMSQYTNFAGVYTVNKILKTRMQVTSGINYYLTIQ